MELTFDKTNSFDYIKNFKFEDSKGVIQTVTPITSMFNSKVDKMIVKEKEADGIKTPLTALELINGKVTALTISLKGADDKEIQGDDIYKYVNRIFVNM